MSDDTRFDRATQKIAEDVMQFDFALNAGQPASFVIRALARSFISYRNRTTDALITYVNQDETRIPKCQKIDATWSILPCFASLYASVVSCPEHIQRKIYIIYMG
jgi:hypothetical protein